ncbi:hypothetical protein [Undibacterium fentianense]|uniref:B12-binding domain-containing protein n=1 Tax=Undibacterium fentianense TaxID=2828728 RepID=A0A941E1R8_9BURK|nr:hypothetical protein [Undibacterium fentianense]MBR7800780.1 hypothetical protein [Undibacterium fentianense]
MQTHFLLINPPQTCIGRRFPQESILPFAMQELSKALLNAGFSVELLDAESDRLSLFKIVQATRRYAPQCVLIGYKDVSSANPIGSMLCTMLRAILPRLPVIVDVGNWHNLDVSSTSC